MIINDILIYEYLNCIVYINLTDNAKLILKGSFNIMKNNIFKNSVNEYIYVYYENFHSLWTKYEI
jgi:hypothetical protein